MAIPSTMVWETNKDHVLASDLNGGGYNPSRAGATTDYTYGASAIVYSYTDLFASGTSISSTNRPFVSADIGNTLRIASGTGIVTEVFEIISVAGGVATVDRNAGSSGVADGVGKLGGMLSTANFASGNGGVAGNIYYIKKAATAYVCNTRYDITGGRFALWQVPCSYSFLTNIEGYTTTRGDGTLGCTEITTSISSNDWPVFLSNGGSSSRLRCKYICLDANDSNVIQYMFYELDRCVGCVAKRFRTEGFRANTDSCYADNSAITRKGLGFSDQVHFNSVARNCTQGFFNCYGYNRCFAIACTTGFVHGSNAYNTNTNLVAYNCTTGFSVQGFGIPKYGIAHTCTTGYSFSGGAVIIPSDGNFAYNCTTPGTGSNVLANDPFVNAASFDFTPKTGADGDALKVSIPQILGGTDYDMWAGAVQGTISGTTGLIASADRRNGGGTY